MLAPRGFFSARASYRKAGRERSGRSSPMTMRNKLLGCGKGSPYLAAQGESTQITLGDAPEAVIERLTSSGTDQAVFSQLLEHQAEGLSSWNGPQLVQLATCLEQSQAELTPAARDALLAAIMPLLPSLTPTQLSQAAWAAGELGSGDNKSWVEALLNATTSALADEFMAPELARTVCSLGAQAKQAEYEVPLSARNALQEEAYYQLQEFKGDFGGQDIARLLSGLADLGVQASGDMHYTIMRAVYHQLKTIEDKAAVDFALAKLESDQSSLHYDPRWTYEEMGWLPRSERDKRRIINETWQRSQWGGYS